MTGGAQKLISLEFESEDQNKVFTAESAKNLFLLTIFGVKTKKKNFTAKFAKERFLLTNSGEMISILEVSGLELHSSGTEPVTFFGAQSSFGGGHNWYVIFSWNDRTWRGQILNFQKSIKYGPPMSTLAFNSCRPEYNRTDSEL